MLDWEGDRMALRRIAVLLAVASLSGCPRSPSPYQPLSHGVRAWVEVCEGAPDRQQIAQMIEVATSCLPQPDALARIDGTKLTVVCSASAKEVGYAGYARPEIKRALVTVRHDTEPIDPSRLAGLIAHELAEIAGGRSQLHAVAIEAERCGRKAWTARAAPASQPAVHP